MISQEELLQIESSQRQHFEVLEHQDRQSLIVEQLEMNLFSMLKPKVFVDGNQFCVLYGENIQEGIAGFGESIRFAIYDFNKQLCENFLALEIIYVKRKVKPCP